MLQENFHISNGRKQTCTSGMDSQYTRFRIMDDTSWNATKGWHRLRNRAKSSLLHLPRCKDLLLKNLGQILTIPLLQKKAQQKKIDICIVELAIVLELQTVQGFF